MSKVLSVIEALFSSIQGFAKANPALAAGAVSVGVTLLARLGLHVDANTLTVIVASLTTLLAGLVHTSTIPQGKHEKEVREARNKGEVLTRPGG